jgi:hypothetical protein
VEKGKRKTRFKIRRKKKRKKKRKKMNRMHKKHMKRFVLLRFIEKIFQMQLTLVEKDFMHL